MLHGKTVQYDCPHGTGIGADAGSGQWTGEKRRKHLVLSPSRVSGEVRTSSSYSPAQGGQEDRLNTISETDLENSGENFHASPEIIEIKNSLKNKNCIFLTRHILEEQEQRDAYKRLVLYRLRAHKLSKGGSDKLDNNTLETELPDFLGTVSIFRLHIEVRYYFESLKKVEDDSVDWYFDPVFSKLKYLSDYQRLVLTNHDGVEYLNLEDYRSNLTTYKMDKDYVMFCDEMSEKLQWLKKYIGIRYSDEWYKMETIGANKALMLTTKFPEMTLDLVYTAYREHIWSLEYDHLLREGWDRIFFEIWKLVTKNKLEFKTALKNVSNIDCVAGQHIECLRCALETTWSDLESKFDSCVKGIPHEAANEFAKEWITKAVLERPKMKTLHQYKKRKMEIAENIRLA